MRSLLITVGSLVLTAGVLTNAYMHKRQFYPSVVYITKSSPSMAVLYLQVLTLIIIVRVSLGSVWVLKVDIGTL